MDLGLALLICLLIFIVVGFVIVQARFAARHWRRVVAGGDREALGQLLDETFEGWRNARPPKGTPPADWHALQTAAVVAADRDRVRVSMLADADVRVVGSERVEVGSVEDVARRAAVRMVERLMYEVPYVSFDRVQVDVLQDVRDARGQSHTACLLTTRADRETVAWSDWDHGSVPELLAEWDTRERSPGASVDAERDAIIAPDELDARHALQAAEYALRSGDARSDGGARS